MPTKVIEVNTLIGTGEGDFYETIDFEFGPASKEQLFIIQSVDKWLDIYDAKIVCENKVIFNGYLWKNIIYKTVCDTEVDKDRTVVVKGDLKQQTIRKRIEGFIDIVPEEGEYVNPKTDSAIVLYSKVIGEVEETIDGTPISVKTVERGCKCKTHCDYEEDCDCDAIILSKDKGKKDNKEEVYIDPPFIQSYKKLHEKLCYKIKLKIVRDQLLEIDYNSVIDEESYK